MPTWSNASFPNSSGSISLLMLAMAFETPFPIQRFLSPSRSSIASFSPVEAPDGTAARPRAPLSSVTSASIVGFPRESRICRPLISRIALMLPLQAAEKDQHSTRPTPAAISPARPESAKTASSPRDAPFPDFRSLLDKILNGDPAASPTRRRAQTWYSLFVAPCAPEGTPPVFSHLRPRSVKGASRRAGVGRVRTSPILSILWDSLPDCHGIY